MLFLVLACIGKLSIALLGDEKVYQSAFGDEVSWAQEGLFTVICF